MAKHMVKCPICGKFFDANEEEYIKNNRRYIHKVCFDQQAKEKTQEEKDFDELYRYCKKIFGENFNFLAMKKTAEKYKKEYNYTYSGMLRTLKYFYEIKGNSIEKSNYGIGIIPYQYEEAYRYFYSMWLTNSSNKPKIIESYEPKVTTIVIKSPELKPLKKQKNFSILEEEDN